MMPKVVVLNGPNLDRLGRRQPELYGRRTWDDLVALCRETGERLGLEVTVSQHSGEGELVDAIHAAADVAEGIVLNAAAYTHTSVAVRDALLAVAVPVVEVHLTNPAARGELRRRNLIGDVVTATVAGFGPESYVLALEGMASLLEAGA